MPPNSLSIGSQVIVITGLVCVSVCVRGRVEVDVQMELPINITLFSHFQQKQENCFSLCCIKSSQQNSFDKQNNSMIADHGKQERECSVVHPWQMSMKTYCTFRAAPEIKSRGCITGDFDGCIRALIHTQLEEWFQVIISLTCHQPCVLSNKRPEAFRTTLINERRGSFHCRGFLWPNIC